MDSLETDNNSLKPVPSPQRSFANKTLRRNKNNDDGSSLSVHSADADRSSLRRSIDRGSRRLSRITDKLDRARSTAASSDGERRHSQDSTIAGRRLSKFLRKGKKDKKDADLGLGLLHANTTGSDGAELLSSRDHSSESVGKAKSIDSSLLTDDSEPDTTERPTLLSRPSHTGYLTLSSPLIAAETVDASQAGLDPVKPQPQASDTLPSADSDTTSAITTKDSGKVATLLPRFRHSFSLGSTPTPLLAAKEEDPAGSNTNLSTAQQDGTISPTLPSVDAARSARILSLKTQSSNVDVPSTVITPATPTVDSPSDASASNSPRRSDSPRLGSLPSPTHRRVKSAAATPSKLSSSRLPPLLSPAIEEVKTPGGSLTQPGGFFSSVFSATQTASNQLTNFFNSPTSSGLRSRSGTVADQEKTGPTGGEGVILSDAQLAKSAENLTTTPHEPAVATLGTGSLTLGHLGISDEASMTSKEDFTNGAPTQSAPIPSKTEEAAAAEAVAAAYTNNTNRIKSASISTADHRTPNGRPLSLSSGGAADAVNGSPPRSIVSGKEGSVFRNNSVRSRISDRTQRRRHRKSSAATGSTSAIAAALSAAHGAVANPTRGRMTSFAMANTKRNKDFHGFFKSVPDDDFLIEDYSAALQREILLHGRLYISERNICFSSNIMGYVTTLVISFDEVVAMEKKNTAMIFPNAIVIQTLHAKNVFASLINRDGTYDLLLGIWRTKHPNLKETEVGHKLDTTVAIAKVEAAESDDGSEDDSDDDSGDEGDDQGSYMDVERASITGSDMGDMTKSSTARAVSTANGALVSAANGTASKAVSPEAAGSSLSLVDFPGPATHAPTECSDSDTHFEKMVLDDTIPAAVGRVYSMIFGPLFGSTMKQMLEEQDSTDIQIEDDKKGLNESVKTNSYSYIKKLSGSIGPKQTKCLITQTLDAFDLEKAVSVTCSTQTPDVPSGNVFITKTRYCLMWGPGGTTRLLMSSGVEWSGKSWIKGPIEKGAEAGQAQHGKDLVAFLRLQLAAKSPIKGGKLKTKGKRKKTIESLEHTTNIKATPKPAAATTSDWGLLEPLHAILGPVADILGPLGNVTSLLVFLLLIMTVLWLRAPSKAVTNQGPGMTPHRLVAYEEMWRREESELWTWLEDRLKLEEVYKTGGASTAQSAQQIVRGREFRDKLETQDMTDRQIDDAIRVTEEKLATLKGVVERNRAPPGPRDEL